MDNSVDKVGGIIEEGNVRRIVIAKATVPIAESSAVGRGAVPQCLVLAATASRALVSRDCA